MEIMYPGMQVEWDRATSTVVAVINADGSRVATGLPGTDVVTRPLRVDFPSGYHPGLARFLGPSHYEEDPCSEYIVQVFPQARVHPDQVLKVLLFDLKELARRLLEHTDWYFIAQAERGAEVPSEVLMIRQEARDAFHRDRTRLLSLSPAEYAEFEPVYLQEAERRTLVFLGIPDLDPEKEEHHHESLLS